MAHSQGSSLGRGSHSCTFSSSRPGWSSSGSRRPTWVRELAAQLGASEASGAPWIDKRNCVNPLLGWSRTSRTAPMGTATDTAHRSCMRHASASAAAAGSCRRMAVAAERSTVAAGALLHTHTHAGVS